MDGSRARYEEGMEKLRGASAVADAFWVTVVEEQDVGDMGVALFQVLIDTLHDAYALLDGAKDDDFVDAKNTPRRAGE